MGPHWDLPTFSEGVEQMYDQVRQELKILKQSTERISLSAIEDLLKGFRVQEDVSTTGGNKIQQTVMELLINSGVDTREL